MDIKEVRNNLLKVMDSIDKDKLSLADLRLYAETLKIVSEIQTKTMMETMGEAMACVQRGFNGYKPPVISEMK